MTVRNKPTVTNRLAQENSSYLLQHAENPVDWYPWGDEALERARQEDKPIFLSIGYSACHWCHVMAHESFEDSRVAGMMNDNFINIKVDREERPDLDSIYMNAVVALTGQGGWPMSLFLTPDGKPFYGGTYFPPTRRYQMPSFREVLQAISGAWKTQRAEIESTSQTITEQLNSASLTNPQIITLQPETLDKAAFALVQAYDWKHGGWGQAPKFPQPMAIEFLLLRASQGDHLALDVALHCLLSMARGGLFDVIGGGFARYSTDNDWLVPHFEKMLYDNAQLALTYLHAFLITKDDRFKQVCTQTLDFIQRELTHPAGGFFSSLDADSEGEEGKYYLWTSAEIHQALPEASDADFMMAAYETTEAGNFESSNVLQRALDDSELAERFNLEPDQIPARLNELHGRLLAARQSRVRPATDDKVLVAWNALALQAFAEAARYLERSDYLEMAMRNAHFLVDNLYTDGRLLRAWRNGRPQHRAALEDYAGLALGLLSLYQSDPDPAWYANTVLLTKEMISAYSDPAGGFFDTPNDLQDLISRPKDMQDNATPCGNSRAALLLLFLSTYTGQAAWRGLAEPMLAGIQPTAARYPTAFGQWLCAIAFALSPVKEVALVGDPAHPDMPALVKTLWNEYRPLALAAISNLPVSPQAPALLAERPLLNDRPTAYVCQHFVCQRPVNSPEEFANLVDGQSA
jgi:uncharacterized protein YyaL (SSP411 family)